MEKPAITDTPIHPLLERRWSSRAFADKPVPKAVLRSLLEAARWSASAFNEQPWRFMIATKEDEAAYAQILDCLTESNQRWAGNAPVLMLVFVYTTFSVDGSPLRTALYDAGLAVQNMVVQATAHDLSVRQMAGIQLDLIREVYHIPENVVPVTGIAIGYRGDPESLIERLRAREQEPRTRKALTEIVFSGDWGHPADEVLSNE